MQSSDPTEQVNLQLSGFLSDIQKRDLGTYTHTHTHIYIYIYKVGDHSRGWPEGSLFDSYHTEA